LQGPLPWWERASLFYPPSWRCRIHALPRIETPHLNLGPNRGKYIFFSKHLQFLGYKEMAGTCAEAGLDGVDLTVRPAGHVLPENVEKDLPRAAAAIREAGLELVMMTTAITDPDDPLTRRILETAATLGIRYYRMGYYQYDEVAGVKKALIISGEPWTNSPPLTGNMGCTERIRIIPEAVSADRYGISGR